MTNAVDSRMGVIVLAGGRSRRMGGSDKAQLKLGSLRVIDYLCSQLPYGVPQVVVSPHSLGLIQVCECPPFGGPVAGIEAGFNYLQATAPRPLTAVLSVDAPDSPRLLRPLTDALDRAAQPALVMPRSSDGFLQPLCSLWRSESLGQALHQLADTRNRSARALISQAPSFAEIPADDATRDYDTPAEFAQFRPNQHLLSERR